MTLWFGVSLPVLLVLVQHVNKRRNVPRMEKLLNGLHAVIILLLGSILADLISSIRGIVVILYRPFDLRLGNLVPDLQNNKYIF